jgi:hypothetical protein
VHSPDASSVGSIISFSCLFLLTVAWLLLTGRIFFTVFDPGRVQASKK